jgi:hypothetical protein
VQHHSVTPKHVLITKLGAGMICFSFSKTPV